MSGMGSRVAADVRKGFAPMDSREIVRRTLEFEYPERVAHSFSPSDFVWAGPEIPNLEGEWRKINDREWRRTDEWGNLCLQKDGR